MADKVTFELEQDGAQYLQTVVNGKGEKHSQVIHADKALDTESLGKTLASFESGATTRRRLFSTLLGHILQNPRMAGYRGGTLASEPKPGANFNKALRQCEDEFFETLVKNGIYKVKPGKNPDDVAKTQQALVVKDKNFENARAYIGRYFAYLGKLPVTASGYIVPMPVIMAELAAIKPAPVAQTLADKIKALIEGMKKEMAYAEVEAALIQATLLRDTLAEAKKRADELGFDVPTMPVSDSAQRLIDAAQRVADKQLTGEALDNAIKAAMKEPESALV